MELLSSLQTNYGLILLFALASIVSPSPTGADAPWNDVVESVLPPRAHELDDSYTFEQYTTHFGKYYDDPDEFDRRSRIFYKNLKKIITHNEGRMAEDGEIIEGVGGYVMGVNMFTDVERHELPLGYNKMIHPAWRGQFEDGAASKIERMLGGATSYLVSKLPENSLLFATVSSLLCEHGSFTL